MKLSYYPNSVLRQVAKKVKEITPAVLKMLDEMLALMYVANGKGGVGIAAPQIGVLKRLLIVDPEAREKENRNPIFMINPKITHFSADKCEYEEGCFSIPEIYAPVIRSVACKVEYTDRDGKLQKLEADGFLSRVIQHEIDHLDGKLFIDHLSSLRRKLISGKLKALEKKYG
ncbi:MAG: peptide deformylase [Alphaproteobacteria bacterium]|nr:MAG: peptide deformylase [Rickettsiaceae bacterium 4572_127]